MPTDTYTFKVTIEGKDAIKQAQAIRKALATEFQQVTTILDVGNIPEAKAELAALKKEARGVGRALTAGFRGAVKRLIDDITTLQEQVNAVVRGGAGPVEQALDELGVMGLDALGMVDAGTTQATQKMARLTKVRAAQARIEALQKRIAELGARPLIPAGSMTGEVRTLDELFKEMTGSRMPQVRRMFRDMRQEFAPLREEIEKQAEAMRAEAAPAYEKAKAELDELMAAHQKVIDQQNQLKRGTQQWRELEEESKLYRQAIFEVGQEISKLRSIMMGVGMSEEMSEYLVLALHPDLTAERRLVTGDGLDLTDGGAGGDAELEVDSTVVRTSGDQTIAGDKTLSDNLLLEGHLRLGEVSKPTHVSNKGVLYCKDVGGDTELFFLDDAGDECQITKDGMLALEPGSIILWDNSDT